MNKLFFNAKPEQTGVRIDKFLSENIQDKTRSAIQKYIESGYVIANGNVISKNYKIKTNDKIEIIIPNPIQVDIVPQDIPLNIIYEDEDVLVVNKEKGMVVHPAVGNYENTLVNALMYHCGNSLSGINGEIRPGIVHRIDKNTSGLLMVAKNDNAHQSLSNQIKEHTFLREYEAIVYGNIKDDNGVIDAPIGRSKNDRKKMCITDKNSKEARTHFTVLERFGNFTYVRFRLETGRTHQIRVHMTYMGHPIAGDDVYGPKKVITKLNGQCLHAKTLGFVHPTTHEFLKFDSDLPEYFEKFLSKLRNQNSY